MFRPTPFTLSVFACIAVIFGCAFFIPFKTAHADVTISPLRVVFENRDRSKDVTLLNLTDKRNTYRLGWVYNRMNENGQYERLETTMTPALDLDNHVIFSPRQVTLPPNSRQKVRLSLRRPADLPPGEYRAHLTFRRLADFGPASEAPSGAGTGQTLKLGVNLGFSIPVVVRQGEYDADVKITNPQFIPVGQSKTGNPRLKLEVNRAGMHGAMGEVRVFWDGSENPDKPIGRLDNVSIFPEMEKRIIEVDLTQRNIPSGTLTVRYYSDRNRSNEVLSELIIPVGG